jgi:hypothetical protein
MEIYDHQSDGAGFKRGGESNSGSPKSIRRGLRTSYRLESTRRSKF